MIPFHQACAKSFTKTNITFYAFCPAFAPNPPGDIKLQLSILLHNPQNKLSFANTKQHSQNKFLLHFPQNRYISAKSIRKTNTTFTFYGTNPPEIIKLQLSNFPQNRYISAKSIRKTNTTFKFYDTSPQRTLNCNYQIFATLPMRSASRRPALSRGVAHTRYGCMMQSLLSKLIAFSFSKTLNLVTIFCHNLRITHNSGIPLSLFNQSLL